MRASASKALLLVAIAALAGCNSCDPMVDRPDANPPADVHADPPGAPVLDPLPVAAPYNIITVRGRAYDAARVVVTVTGLGSPRAVTVLPDYSFCLDIPVPTEGEYMLEARASAAGLESIEAAYATTQFDLSAPRVPGASRCDGSDPFECMSPPPEDCSMPGDEDCDGFADTLDTDCADCIDDVLEPNDTVSAPTVSPDRYDGMHVCPANDDYYPVMVRVGQQLTARIFFLHAAGNLDMLILAPDGMTELGRAASTDDDESLAITASADGRHIVRVFGVSGAENSYALDIDVTM